MYSNTVYKNAQVVTSLQLVRTQPVDGLFADLLQFVRFSHV